METKAIKSLILKGCIIVYLEKGRRVGVGMSSFRVLREQLNGNGVLRIP